jgi:hypothetical protein
VHRVEREAPGHLTQPDVSIAGELRLPHLDRNGGPVLAWLPAQPNLAVQMVAGMTISGGPGPGWHEAIDERDRRRREDSERLSAFYEARGREAEKRRGAELRDAREAHRRQHGW